QSERFQATFKKDGPLRSALTDAKGNFLAVSEGYLEARQGRYYGGPQALGIAGLQVNLLAPREEIEVSWWQATDQTLIFMGGFFLLSFLFFTALCLMGGVRWLARVELGRRFYRDEDVPVGASPVVAPLAKTPAPVTTPVPRSLRWYVNNGTAVQGPFAAVELSQKLYVQEVDFDCVCWNESDDPAQGTMVLRDSGLFLEGVEVLGINPETTSEFEQKFWIYRAGCIHGPLTVGQIDVLVRKLPVTTGGEIPAETEIQICVDSTVQGWRWLDAWAREVQWPKPFRRRNPPKDEQP
ncbi:MAG: hypothetical protein AAB425_01735, partial [Bdellovibrionota bacterium]